MSEDIEQEWESLEPRRIAGDWRKNPFPSLSETENRLIMLIMKDMISESVAAGFAKFQKDNCEKHQERTANVEVSLFGDNDHRGLVGRVRDHDDVLKQLTDDIRWSKRLVYTAIATGCVSLIVTTILR